MLTPNVQDHSFEECAKIGRTLAEAGLGELERLGMLPVETFAVQSAQVRVRLTNP